MVPTVDVVGDEVVVVAGLVIAGGEPVVAGTGVVVGTVAASGPSVSARPHPDNRAKTAVRTTGARDGAPSGRPH